MISVFFFLSQIKILYQKNLEIKYFLDESLIAIRSFFIGMARYDGWGIWDTIGVRKGMASEI